MTLFLRTHGPGECSGEFCVIHNPSDHPLRNATITWALWCEQQAAQIDARIPKENR